MIKNFIKITLRGLTRNKAFSTINIVGLAVGMAAAMLIMLWVQNEFSFDRFYGNTDRISLLYNRDMNNGKIDVWDNTPALMAPELKKNYPEVEDAARFRIVYFLTTVGDKHLNSEGSFADSTFLSVFNFPILEGNAKASLNDEHDIVVTQSLAKKLFGDADPMGKTVRIDSNFNFKVSAVLKDLPANTNFTFQYILPWAFTVKLGWFNNQTWAASNANTYVVLKEGASREAFDVKIRNIIKSHIATGDGAMREVISQPLSQVHLYSQTENGQFIGGRIDTVKIFITIAVFILLIACINFMNLSTARSERRAREAGIRKVVGAARGALIFQFIGESTVFALIAFLLALFVVQVSLPAFNSIVNTQLSIHFANPLWWLFATALILLMGIVAGSYPAFFLTSFKPAQVLKGSFKNAKSKFNPRRVLVVLQFTFAITLIICTIIVDRQLQLARNRDAGYKRSGLAYVFSQGDVLKNYKLIKHDLLNTGAAVGVTKLFSPITRVWGTQTGLTWPGSTVEDKKINFLQFEADADFTKTTGTKLVDGRDIDVDAYPTDSTALLLNEAAVKAMRLQNPVGKLVVNGRGVTCHVVGVVKDFVIESPYEEVKPMVIQGLNTTYPVVHFRLNPANTTAENLAKAEKIFKQYNPEYPFEYVFADDAFSAKFRQEQQDGSLSVLFAALTIFISCLGLFGLATYVAESRTKEIGIRKVLGASVSGITALLSMDFVKLVVISILIATPIAWVVMRNWLAQYTYRTTLDWWIFATAGLGSILIALLTVSFQSIKAALMNPVRSLKTE